MKFNKKKLFGNPLFIISIIVLIILVYWTSNQGSVSDAAAAYGADQTITPETCEQYGGRVQNIMGGEGCASDEYVIGEVVGLRCTCLCCAAYEE